MAQAAATTAQIVDTAAISITTTSATARGPLDAAWRTAHLQSMQAAVDPGVPLAHYRQHRGGVTLICLDCNGHRVFDLEAVIRRLSARGVGGETTGVRAVV